MIRDAYEILTAVASHPLGAEALVKKKVLTSMCHAVAGWKMGKKKCVLNFYVAVDRLQSCICMKMIC